MPNLSLNQQHAREHSLELAGKIDHLAENLRTLARTMRDEGNVSEETLDATSDAMETAKRIHYRAIAIRQRKWLDLVTTRRVDREAALHEEEIRAACQAEEARLTEARSRSRQVADRINRQREEAR